MNKQKTEQTNKNKNEFNNKLFDLRKIDNDNSKNKIKEIDKKIKKEKDKNNNISIRFKSIDQLINYSAIYHLDKKILNIEKELYNKYPILRKKGCRFIYNGMILQKSKTLRENHVKSEDVIMINYIYDEELDKNQDYIAIDFIYKGECYPMVCNKDDNIFKIKDNLCSDILGIKYRDFLLIHKGIVISDNERLLRNYDIKCGDTILIYEAEVSDSDDKDDKNNERSEEFIIIHFISIDQDINSAIRCNKFEKFYEVENKLYNKFPNIRDKNCYFLGNGGRIERHKTLEKSNIENGDKLIIVYDD